MQAADRQRTQLRAPQLAEARVGDAEDVRRGTGDRELVQRMEEEVLREMPLRDRSQRAAHEARAGSRR